MIKHKNPMDDIIIRYGQPQMRPSQKMNALLDKMIKEHKSQEQAEKEFEAKEIPLSEFLKLKKEELSADEQKIQLVLEAIHSLNSGYPPIYRSFPKRENPLVIDITFLDADKNLVGAYRPATNDIIFSKIEHLGFSQLIEVFSHELKHAQQYLKNENDYSNYQEHQLGLKEAQARACEDRVMASLCPDDPRAENFQSTLLLFSIFDEEGDKYLGDEKASLDWKLKNVEEIRVWKHLEAFLIGKKYGYEYYKDTYDRTWPIQETEPLTKIPPEFDIVSPERVLEILKKVPKTPRLPINKAVQAITNSKKRALSILLKSKDTEGNFLLSDENIPGVMLDAFSMAEATNKTDLFETVLKSGRCSQKDMEETFVYVFHLMEDEKLTDELLEIRKKLLKVLLAQKTPNGKKIISEEKIKEAIDFSRQEVEYTNNDEQLKLADRLESYIDSTKKSLRKRLKSSSNKTKSASPRKDPTPEI